MADPTADAPRRHPPNNFGVSEKRRFTVAGVYEDNEQPCCFHVTSDDPGQAIVDARFVAGHDFYVAGVFAGHLDTLDCEGDPK